LFDFDLSDIDLLDDIKKIFEKLNLQIKISYGNNYDF